MKLPFQNIVKIHQNMAGDYPLPGGSVTNLVALAVILVWRLLA
jgi:hypothetical protein